DRNTVTNRTTSDAQTRIVQVLDAHDALVMTYEYAAFDSEKITTITDYSGRSVRYHWDGAELLGVTDVRGEYWAYEYGANGEIIARVDPLNRKTRISYVGGIVTQITQPSGFSIAYTYDFDEIRKRYYMRKQDSAGRVEERWYDQEGVLLEVRVDGLLVQKTTESAQGYNRIRQRQFVGGRTLTQTYNQNGKLLKLVRNDGSYDTAEYAGQYQKISSHRAASSKLSSFEYDHKGNLIRMTEAVGTALQRVVEFAYDQYGQRIRITSPADALTQAASYEIEYDNHGNANKLTAPLNSVQQLDYNVTGRVIRSVSAGNGSGSNVTQLEYDQAGSLLSITDPLNRVYRAVYDAAGQRTQVTAPNGRVVRYSYDANGRSTGVAAYAGDNKLTSMSYQ